MKKLLWNLAGSLGVTIEEELAGENTSAETIEDMDYYLERLNNIWNEYKRVNNLNKGGAK
jgi:glycine cleavage system protein P-like pyridoxal-binding family